ncbi:MAG: phosphatidate cytidylyltransferase, partial [Gammaproteobacteria bacterium]
MIRTRLVTAAWLGSLTIGSAVVLDTPWFAGFMALFLAAGAWEWADLSGLSGAASRTAYVIVMGALAL